MPHDAAQTDGISFTLNGRPARAAVFPAHTTLLDFLRSEGLTGAKEGCAEGECGACAIVMVKPHGSGSAYVPVNSCLMFLPMAAGQEIYTVEALAAFGALAPVQHAIAERGGSQCGYCTPGFVMSLFAEQHRPDRAAPCDPHAMAGNLCRCTGYRPLRDAAHSLGPAPAGPFLDRLALPAPPVAPFRTTHFSRPATLAECLDLLAADPSARPIAGATDLAVESNLKFRRFPHLVSLEALPELRIFRDTPGALEIGAALTLSEIDPFIPPTLARLWNSWLPLFASPLIRNRATLGGNLATASPIGDSAPLLLSLDAQVRIASPAGQRLCPLDSFFLAYRQTALQPGELLVSILIPKPIPSAAAFYKAAKRRMDDISTLAACFALDIDSRGVIQRARLAYGGVAATPLRAREAEAALEGSRWNEFALERAQSILARTLHPIGDHRGSAAYRLALAQSLLEKFWWERSQEAAA
jgi:xanthine dehydrogenase small subunit